MRLYVIRHGHKAINEPGFECAYNTPLSDTGREQAEHLASFLSDESIDILYSSCALRALETAEPVEAAIDVAWHVWPALSEFMGETWPDRRAAHGEDALPPVAWPTGQDVDTPATEELKTWDGNYYLLSSLPDRYPVELSQPFPWPDAWWTAKEHQTRTVGAGAVALAYKGLAARHDETDRVAVVCHGNSGRALLAAHLGLALERDWDFHFDNTGVTRVDDSGSIAYSNRTAHLPPELRV